MHPTVLGQSTQVIVWGSELKFGNVLTSDGGAITLDEYKFELGSFGGFVPTTDNTDDWLMHWKIFDAITVDDTPDNDAFIAGEGSTAIFGGRADLSSARTSNSEDADPTDTFSAGEQAYVFVRSGDLPEGDAEWLLYTSESVPDWGFPGSFAEELQWYLPDAETVVWGAINNNMIGGGNSTGGAEEFYLQTHSFESVPEPSSVLYFVSVGSLLIIRRKRKSFSRCSY
ncbi:MAG: PEP-CTERM sorting domain-containing protein [Roseibacillus sp.]